MFSFRMSQRDDLVFVSFFEEHRVRRRECYPVSWLVPFYVAFPFRTSLQFHVTLELVPENDFPVGARHGT